MRKLRTGRSNSSERSRVLRARLRITSVKTKRTSGRKTGAFISAGFVEQYTKAQGENLPLDARLTTLRVGLDSRWIGRTVSQIESEEGLLVLLVERGDAAFRPGSAFRVAEGDRLGVYRRK